ncbi:hypothetical protein DFH11DRAFT_1876690 [Phellopilus nigrolimitatus]|nr:hypothetical protein DFH11DRAFT_1876690 [Phellopilus nigrolimitatus]
MQVIRSGVNRSELYKILSEMCGASEAQDEAAVSVSMDSTTNAASRKDGTPTVGLWHVFRVILAVFGVVEQNKLEQAERGLFAELYGLYGLCSFLTASGSLSAALMIAGKFCSLESTR